MKRKLFELAKGFAEESGCDYTANEGDVCAVLTVEGLAIHIGLEERTGMLLFQTGIGLFPETLTIEERAEFFLSLLRDNNLFKGTRGFTLGIDEDNGLVTLQLAWDINSLSNEGFGNLMVNFITVCGEWLVKLDAWRPSAPAATEAAAPEDNFAHMLKV